MAEISPQAPQTGRVREPGRLVAALPGVAGGATAAGRSGVGREAAGQEVGLTQATVLAAHLRAHASSYFPEWPDGSIEVRLVRREVRAVSRLYRFLVSSGSQRRGVLVKVPTGFEPLGHAREAAPLERPRLCFALPPHERLVKEYQSLAAIHEHFRRLEDPRFGTVRVFDLLTDEGALVMEVAAGTTLRRLVHRSHRGSSAAGAAELETAFRHAGAWLRAYQALSMPAPPEPLQARRAEYVHFVERVATFLGDHLGDAAFFARVAAAVRAAAERVLPEALPLGIGHGDFALRNVIIGPQSRVTVLDTAARYRTPVYADIGYFLVSLRYNWPQVLSFGLAFPADRLARFERAFLAGFFGNGPVPFAAVRLYEVQATLDLWAAAALRFARARGPWTRLTESVRLARLTRILRRRIGEEYPDAAA